MKAKTARTQHGDRSSDFSDKTLPHIIAEFIFLIFNINCFKA